MEQKPSAEMQAIVMNLWNVIREVAQANAATYSENKAYSQKQATLAEEIRLEREHHAKLQSYAEHLETELKQQRHDAEVLQASYNEALENAATQAAVQQDLRQMLAEQEEVIMRRGDENESLRQQLNDLHQVSSAENQSLRASLDALKNDLASSRQQALSVAAEVDEFQAELDAQRKESETLYQENEQLRWRLEALEQNSAKEMAEMERKLEEARLHSGEMTVRFDEAQRFSTESEARINALSEERNTLRESLQRSEQESVTWQQIAEEQTQRITELQKIEQEFREMKEQYNVLQQNYESAKSEAEDAASKYVSEKNMYESALENVKSQLQEARLHHQQSLAAHADEQEKIQHELEQQIDALSVIIDKKNEQLRHYETSQERLRNGIHISDEERDSLKTAVDSLLSRVESALADFEK